MLEIAPRLGGQLHLGEVLHEKLAERRQLAQRLLEVVTRCVRELVQLLVALPQLLIAMEQLVCVRRFAAVRVHVVEAESRQQHAG